ncbi:hypothetical protein ILUMI_09921 [Ignelater luminosus]|uniref:Uncharacterized protein n=1 Tax=Ignelater luminosus TaxID=2038154 RepID=A0A8K0D1E9_IGNLU|nr:hypothetical protein ILUMI_09921 [Ignelater luminosus]
MDFSDTDIFQISIVPLQLLVAKDIQQAVHVDELAKMSISKERNKTRVYKKSATMKTTDLPESMKRTAQDVTYDEYFSKQHITLNTLLTEFIVDIMVRRETSISNLKQKSVIVLDNASYHLKLLSLQLASAWKKRDIRHWLDNPKINYVASALKLDMLLAKQNVVSKQCPIDYILQEHGHAILRLPSYHG